MRICKFLREIDEIIDVSTQQTSCAQPAHTISTTPTGNRDVNTAGSW
jgi:hypothetical protein